MRTRQGFAIERFGFGKLPLPAQSIGQRTREIFHSIRIIGRGSPGAFQSLAGQGFGFGGSALIFEHECQVHERLVCLGGGRANRLRISVSASRYMASASACLLSRSSAAARSNRGPVSQISPTDKRLNADASVCLRLATSNSRSPSATTRVEGL